MVKGASLGFSVGITPGPLTILVITQTFRYGWREGFKVSLAPVITDFPIMAISYVAISQVSELSAVLGSISIIGAVFLGKMAIDTWRAPTLTLSAVSVAPNSIFKGLMTNLLNPHPYLFWISIGTPILLKSATTFTASVASFMGSLFLFMVGMKVFLAILTKRYSRALSGTGYRRCLQVAVMLLAFFSLQFAMEEFHHFGRIR
jgi:threonine/homoserine/homoserine lactone efflux protein